MLFLERRQVEQCQGELIHLRFVDFHPVLLRVFASAKRPAIVPMLRHGRPSQWAKRESSRIIVAERSDCQTSIIPNWQCSTASGHPVRAAFTSSPSISSLRGTAPN